jgi:hypothetical protein
MRALTPNAARAAFKGISKRAIPSCPHIAKAQSANSSRVYSHRRQLLGALLGAPVLAGSGMLRAAPAAAVGEGTDAIAKVRVVCFLVEGIASGEAMLFIKAHCIAAADKRATRVCGAHALQHTARASFERCPTTTKPTQTTTKQNPNQKQKKVLEDPKWPEQWPFRAEDFLRYDEADDAAFYSAPRFVYHIDEGAVAALTK